MHITISGDTGMCSQSVSKTDMLSLTYLYISNYRDILHNTARKQHQNLNPSGIRMIF